MSNQKEIQDNVEIMEIHCHTFLTKISGKYVMFLLKSWFDEFILGDSKFFIFPH